MYVCMYVFYIFEYIVYVCMYVFYIFEYIVYVCMYVRKAGFRPWTPSLRIFAVRVYKQLNLKINK